MTKSSPSTSARNVSTPSPGEVAKHIIETSKCLTTLELTSHLIVRSAEIDIIAVFEGVGPEVQRVIASHIDSFDADNFRIHESYSHVNGIPAYLVRLRERESKARVNIQRLQSHIKANVARH